MDFRKNAGIRLHRRSIALIASLTVPQRYVIVASVKGATGTTRRMNGFVSLLDMSGARRKSCRFNNASRRYISWQRFMYDHDGSLPLPLRNGENRLLSVDLDTLFSTRMATWKSKLSSAGEQHYCSAVFAFFVGCSRLLLIESWLLFLLNNMVYL